jgi:hypothetical protein
VNIKESKVLRTSIFDPEHKVYCRMGKHKLALDWFNKALDIREKIYPIGHKKIEKTKNIIEQTIKDDFFSVLYL